MGRGRERVFVDDGEKVLEVDRKETEWGGGKFSKLPSKNRRGQFFLYKNTLASMLKIQLFFPIFVVAKNGSDKNIVLSILPSGPTPIRP